MTQPVEYALGRDMPFSICGVCGAPMPLEEGPDHHHEDCTPEENR